MFWRDVLLNLHQERLHREKILLHNEKVSSSFSPRMRNRKEPFLLLTTTLELCVEA